jgi:hypothetical protein
MMNSCYAKGVRLTFCGGTVDAHFGGCVGIAASVPSLRSMTLASCAKPVISSIGWSTFATANEQLAASTPARRTLECILADIAALRSKSGGGVCVDMCEFLGVLIR